MSHVETWKQMMREAVAHAEEGDAEVARVWVEMAREFRLAASWVEGGLKAAPAKRSKAGKEVPDANFG